MRAGQGVACVWRRTLAAAAHHHTSHTLVGSCQLKPAASSTTCGRNHPPLRHSSE